MGDAEEYVFNFDRSYLTNKPYFDINHAIEEYSLDFESLSDDNFSDFISEFTLKYKNMRKCYITRDLTMFRKHAHAIKNVFT